MARYTDKWHYYCQCGRKHHRNSPPECKCGDHRGVGRLHPDDDWGA